MFRQLSWTALIAGTLTGLLMTLIQTLQVVPLIVAAEHFEQGSTLAVVEGHGHGLAPEGGIDLPLDRTLRTTLSNMLAGIGFALVLGAAMQLRGERSGLRQGLWWGAAGFVTFFAAPSLGLPPELPGSWAAALGERQLWWLLTVSLTALGLALLAFGVKRRWHIGGVVLLLIPHLIGAPQPLAAGGTVPEALAQQFWLATTLSSALFWLALGSLSGWLYPRMKRS